MASAEVSTELEPFSRQTPATEDRSLVQLVSLWKQEGLPRIEAAVKERDKRQKGGWGTLSPARVPRPPTSTERGPPSGPAQSPASLRTSRAPGRRLRPFSARARGREAITLSTQIWPRSKVASSYTVARPGHGRLPAVGGRRWPGCSLLNVR